MNSENRDKTNATPRIQKETWARRVLRKRLSLSRVSSDNTRASASIQPYPGIDQHVKDVREQPPDHHHDAGQEYDPHDHVIVAVHHGIENQQSHAVYVENPFDENGAREHDGEDLPYPRGHGDESVPESVAPNGLAEGGTGDHGRAHVILADFLQQAVLEQHGQK